MTHKPITPTLTHADAARLLERFYAGESTIQDELALHAFLCSESCPPEWEADREVLATAMLTPEAALPATLTEGIGRKLKRHIHQQWWRSLVGYSMSAAAVAIVALTALQRPPASPTVYADTCLTPREAAVETEHTLLYVSTNLNMALNSADDELGGPCP